MATVDAWPQPLSATPLPLWRPSGTDDVLDPQWSKVTREHAPAS